MTGNEGFSGSSRSAAEPSMHPMRHEPNPPNVPRGRAMTVDEILGLFAPSTRAAVGMVLYTIADELADKDGCTLRRRGLAIAGEATGLLGADDLVKDKQQPQLAQTVLELIVTDGLWVRELADGTNDDSPA